MTLFLENTLCFRRELLLLTLTPEERKLGEKALTYGQWDAKADQASTVEIEGNMSLFFRNSFQIVIFYLLILLLEDVKEYSLE